MPFTPSARIATSSTPIETRTAGGARRRRRSQRRRTAGAARAAGAATAAPSLKPSVHERAAVH